MDKEERKKQALDAIHPTKRRYTPRSPLMHVILGGIFGVVIYFIGPRDFSNSLRAGVFFALGMSFIDYCYVYYIDKRKEQ